VALGHQLGDGALVQGPRDEEDDVVYHVPIGDVVHEGADRLNRVVAHVLELNHKPLAKLVVDHRHLEGRGLVGKEAAVVRALEVKLQVIESFALDQVEVVSLPEDAVPKASADALQVAGIDVEDTVQHLEISQGL